MNVTAARTLALALVLTCGAPVSIAASGELVLTRAQAGTAMSLPGGRVFHVADGVVFNPRMVTVPGTPTVISTWQERLADRSTRNMYAIALNGRTADTVQQVNYVIDLMYASFDPLVALPSVPQNLRAPAGNELYIVQFVAQPLPSMQAAVRAAGGAIERYLPEVSQVVRMTPEARARVSALPFVRWVGEYHTAYRMSPAVFAVAAESQGGGVDYPARYSIETMRDGPAQQQALVAMIRAMGGSINVLTLDQARMEATLTPAQLRAVAARNEVNFIDPWLGPGGADMDMIRQIGGAVPILENAGFTGQGVRGEVFDTECRNTHQGFQSPSPIKHSAGWGAAANAHGTACYGINFAKWAGQPNATGMLPDREQGIFYLFSEASSFGGGTSRLTLNTQATSPTGQYKSSYQTSSVGNAWITTYSTLSAETDDYLFKVDYLSCQSQSNTGNQMSRPEAWAKNILSVGGIDHKNTLTKNDDSVSGASIGPASDGRTKPDLAHSYLQVYTTWNSSDTATIQFSGTSGATPIVAGHFGLLMQMWHEGVWENFGGGSSVFADRPMAATAKAMMINNAYRYTWTGQAPPGEPVRSTLTREIQGWGMPDVGRLYTMAEKSYAVNETDVLLPLGNKSYNIDVAVGEPGFNVTMVYKDPKGNPATQATHRVNNLDLKVTSPGGVVYLGNHGLTKLSVPGPTNVSITGGTSDEKNTVENVFLRNPEPGQWKVEVTATQLVQDGHPATPAIDAVYGLAVSGGVLLPPVQISLPSGLPEAFAPGADNWFDFVVEPGSQTPVISGVKVLYRMSGSGAFTEATVEHQGGNEYRANIVPSGCGQTPEFYFSGQGDTGGITLLPETAPAEFFSVPVGQVVSVFDDDFEVDVGWSVENVFVQSGAWERDVPSAIGSTGAPTIDYDGSGRCFVTGPLTAEDVDGGPTILTSPVFDLSGMNHVKISYARWHFTNQTGITDNLRVFVSDDDGQNWEEVETVRSTETGWVVNKFTVADYVTPTSQVRLRLEVADELNNSITEAGVDAVRVTKVQCEASCYPDCNQDGSLNLADFGCFQTKFASGDPEADCNGDSVLNLADFGCFQTQFAAGCP